MCVCVYIYIYICIHIYIYIYIYRERERDSFVHLAPRGPFLCFICSSGFPPPLGGEMTSDCCFFVRCSSSANILQTAQTIHHHSRSWLWIPFGDHPLEFERYRED